MIIIGQNSNNNHCRLLGPIGPHREKTIRILEYSIYFIIKFIKNTT